MPCVCVCVLATVVEAAEALLPLNSSLERGNCRYCHHHQHHQLSADVVLPPRHHIISVIRQCRQSGSMLSGSLALSNCLWPDCSAFPPALMMLLLLLPVPVTDLLAGQMRHRRQALFTVDDITTTTTTTATTSFSYRQRMQIRKYTT